MSPDGKTAVKVPNLKLENAEKSLKSVQKELDDSSRKIVRLETELADKKERNDRNERTDRNKRE